jgi:hypothetical protein
MHILLIMAVAFGSVETYVFTHYIKGVTISNSFIMVYSLIITLSTHGRENVIANFLKLVSIFIIIQILAVTSGLLDGMQRYNEINFVSNDFIGDIRLSVITQSVYLVVAILLFTAIRASIKQRCIKIKKNLDSAYKFSLVIAMVYGFYDIGYFYFYGVPGDFLSNRITGDDYSFGTSQIINIDGISVLRFRGLSGEPSMYAYYATLGFIYCHMNKSKLWPPLLVTLILTYSTTFMVGLSIYIIYRLMNKVRTVATLVWILLAIASLYLFTGSYWAEVALMSVNKFTGANQSGVERAASFYAHYNSWIDSSFPSFIFGHGFGVVRSTDFISTLLFNCGIMGFVIFTIIYARPLFRNNQLVEVDSLRPVLLASYFMLLISTSEPYSLSNIYFLALSYSGGNLVNRN